MADNVPDRPSLIRKSRSFRSFPNLLQPIADKKRSSLRSTDRVLVARVPKAKDANVETRKQTTPSVTVLGIPPQASPDRQKGKTDRTQHQSPRTPPPKEEDVSSRYKHLGLTDVVADVDNDDARDNNSSKEVHNDTATDGLGNRYEGQRKLRKENDEHFEVHVTEETLVSEHIDDHIVVVDFPDDVPINSAIFPPGIYPKSTSSVNTGKTPPDKMYYPLVPAFEKISKKDRKSRRSEIVEWPSDVDFYDYDDVVYMGQIPEDDVGYGSLDRNTTVVRSENVSPPQGFSQDKLSVRATGRIQSVDRSVDYGSYYLEPITSACNRSDRGVYVTEDAETTKNSQVARWAQHVQSYHNSQQSHPSLNIDAFSSATTGLFRFSETNLVEVEYNESVYDDSEGEDAAPTPPAAPIFHDEESTSFAKDEETEVDPRHSRQLVHDENVQLAAHLTEQKRTTSVTKPNVAAGKVVQSPVLPQSLCENTTEYSTQAAFLPSKASSTTKFANVKHISTNSSTSDLCNDSIDVRQAAATLEQMLQRRLSNGQGAVGGDVVRSINTSYEPAGSDQPPTNNERKPMTTVPSQVKNVPSVARDRSSEKDVNRPRMNFTTKKKDLTPSRNGGANFQNTDNVSKRVNIRALNPYQRETQSKSNVYEHPVPNGDEQMQVTAPTKPTRVESFTIRSGLETDEHENSVSSRSVNTMIERFESLKRPGRTEGAAGRRADGQGRDDSMVPNRMVTSRTWSHNKDSPGPGQLSSAQGALDSCCYLEETMAEVTSLAAVSGEDIFAIKEKIRCLEGQFLTPDLLLDTHKLPQLVKVTYAECEAPGLSKNEILLLHFTYSSKKVMAQSLSQEGGILVGPELNIPLAYPGRFELLQSQSNVKVFERLEEVVSEDLQSQMPVVRLLVEEDILNSELPPSGVASPEMGTATTRQQQLLCKKGDVITILYSQPIEPSAPVQQLQEIPELQKKGLGQKLKGKFKGKGKRTSQMENKESEEQRQKLIFTCSNQDGEMVTLPGELKARFTLKPLEFESGTTYTVENIIDNFKLPQDVKLVHGDCPGEDDEFTGYVRLFHTYRDEVIVGTSVQDDGQISQVEFSINTDIQFSPADLELSENKEILCLFQSNVRTSVLVDSKNMDSFILVMGKPYSSIYQDRTKLFKPADLATYPYSYANVGDIAQLAPTNPIYEETPDYQDPDLHKAVVPSAPPIEEGNSVGYYSPVEPPTEKDDSTDKVAKPEIKPRRNKMPPTVVPVGFVGELKKAQESKKTRPPVPPRPKGSATAATSTSDRNTGDDYTDLTGGTYTALKPITTSTVEGPTSFAAFENTVYDTLHDVTPEGDHPAAGKRASFSVKDLVKQMETKSEIISYKTPLNIPLALPKEPEQEEEHYEFPPHSSNAPDEQGENKGEMEYQSPPHVPTRSPDELKCDDDSPTYDSPKSPAVQATLPKPSATGYMQGTKGSHASQQVPVGVASETHSDYDNVTEIYFETPAMTDPSGKDERGQSADPSPWVPPDDLSTLSVSEVTACLRHLGLGNDVIAAFERERIDGALLYDVDETIMTQDMNLRKLDALKILKFIRGWRP
ncbi:hypothetical protein Bbelb_410900 [Branchiostoma belcheri]|nr:hypothetical protein Bbelb_410900 [Branchiostoma belcheri]